MRGVSEKLDYSRLTYQARYYLWLFYLLGQNSLNPLKNRNEYYNKPINVAPAILSIVLSLCIAIAGIFYRFNYNGFYEQTDSVVTYFLLALHFATNFVTMLQSLFYASDIELLLKKFETVRMQTKQYFHYDIEYEHFSKGYRRKASIVLIFFCVSALIRSFFKSAKTHIVVQTAQMLLLGYTLTDNLHALFYIQMLLFFLSSLISCVKNLTIQSKLIYKVQLDGNTIMANNLRYVKQIHYLLFNISMLINNRFGWSLIALMILNFVEVAYTSYWIFLYLSAYHSHLFIRKYNTKFSL